MSLETVRAAARGRWQDILADLGGIDRSRLVNRHGPCPCCGDGKDRFRFDDKGGDGTWFCNVCGAGDGFSLLAGMTGWDYSRALREVGDMLRVPRDGNTERTDELKSRRDWLRQMMRECSADRSPLQRYLEGRGISTLPPTLRYHPSLPYTVDGKETGRHPAMLAVVTGKDGSAQGIHRTYLADVATRKKLTPAVRSYSGGAIQIMPADGPVLAIAEGIETALSVHEMTAARGKPVPAWAAGNTTLLEQWEPPEGVSRVLICADHDENYAGHAAAYRLAHRLATRKHPVDVEVRLPDAVGDWNDVWVARSAAE